MAMKAAKIYSEQLGFGIWSRERQRAKREEKRTKGLRESSEKTEIVNEEEE